MVNRSVVAVLALVGLAAGACGSAGPQLSSAAAVGRETAQGAGCMSCHGADGQGGVGPAWSGLFGSEVDLAGGTRVIADEAYLRRSILDPGAETVDTYTLDMPTNSLSASEADEIIDYIKELK